MENELISDTKKVAIVDELLEKQWNGHRFKLVNVKSAVDALCDLLSTMIANYSKSPSSGIDMIQNVAEFNLEQKNETVQNLNSQSKEDLKRFASRFELLWNMRHGDNKTLNVFKREYMLGANLADTDENLRSQGFEQFITTCFDKFYLKAIEELLRLKSDMASLENSSHTRTGFMGLSVK